MLHKLHRHILPPYRHRYYTYRFAIPPPTHPPIPPPTHPPIPRQRHLESSTACACKLRRAKVQSNSIKRDNHPKKKSLQARAFKSMGARFEQKISLQHKTRCNYKTNSTNRNHGSEPQQNPVLSFPSPSRKSKESAYTSLDHPDKSLTGEPILPSRTANQYLARYWFAVPDGKIGSPVRDGQILVHGSRR